MRHVHVITPGDHFSDMTGSAVPTVVHGLCSSTPASEPRPAVAVAIGTYPNRYRSADIIEYAQRRPLRLPNPLSERHIDGLLSRLRLPRVCSRRQWAATVAAQESWEPSIVIGHNAIQLMPLIDARRHVPVLYAHNRLFRTYRSGEILRVMGGVAAIVAVSQSLADHFRSELPQSLGDKVRVVRNGVDFQAFHAERDRKDSEILKVLFVGRMIPEKGPDVLVEAMKLLGRNDVHLTLVGSAGFDPAATLTAYEQQVRAQASALGSHVRVSPFVPRTQVITLMQDADVVVVPSRWPEPFALTILEGMASGAAVIGSDVGGIPESLRTAGVVVPPDDPAQLAGAIARFADDSLFLAEQQHASVEYARTQDWSRVRLRLNEVLS